MKTAKLLSIRIFLAPSNYRAKWVRLSNTFRNQPCQELNFQRVSGHSGVASSTTTNNKSDLTRVPYRAESGELRKW